VTETPFGVGVGRTTRLHTAPPGEMATTVVEHDAVPDS